MRICPECHTKYTDATLKFCLQDGKELSEANEEKTLVLDSDFFANEKTFAENLSPKTSAFEKIGTDENVISGGTSSPAEQVSIPTVNRGAIADSSRNFDTNSKIEGNKVSFLKGLFIGFGLIGLLIAGILAGLYLPSMVSSVSNSNTNSNGSRNETGKILSNSSNVKLSSSSSRKTEAGNHYLPELVFDGNSRTAWAEAVKGGGKGEWIAFDFDEEVTLSGIIIEPGYFKTDELWRKNNRVKEIKLKFSSGETRGFEFPSEMKEQKLDLSNVKTKSVMITIMDFYPGEADAEDTLISEVKFIIK